MGQLPNCGDIKLVTELNRAGDDEAVHSRDVEAAGREQLLSEVMKRQLERARSLARQNQQLNNPKATRPKLRQRRGNENRARKVKKGDSESQRLMGGRPKRTKKARGTLRHRLRKYTAFLFGLLTAIQDMCGQNGTSRFVYRWLVCVVCAASFIGPDGSSTEITTSNQNATAVHIFGDTYCSEVEHAYIDPVVFFMTAIAATFLSVMIAAIRIVLVCFFQFLVLFFRQ